MVLKRVLERNVSGSLGQLKLSQDAEFDHRDTAEGWHQYYWLPWKEYLAKKRKA
jgi:hypothetical protein